MGGAGPPTAGRRAHDRSKGIGAHHPAQAAMTKQPTLTLNDGNVIPQFGLGVWQVPNARTAQVVSHAISTGYRLIDTAAIYENESGTGSGIAQKSVPREELFITTKLWNSEHRNAPRAFLASLNRLKR